MANWTPPALGPEARPAYYRNMKRSSDFEIGDVIIGALRATMANGLGNDAIHIINFMTGQRPQTGADLCRALVPVVLAGLLCTAAAAL